MRTVIIFCLCLSAFAAQAQNDVNYTYMDSLFQQLPEVLVKGERPVVKAERGKLVYDLPRMVERLPVNNAYEAVKETARHRGTRWQSHFGGAQYYFGSKWKSKYTGQGRFEVRASEYPCQSSGESGNHVCCSGTLPHSWSDGECYSKIEYRAEAFLVR